MHYRDLIKETEIIEIKNGGIDVQISDVVYDSRTAVPDALFVAIFGFATDGHRFVEDAVKRGAKVIVHQAELEEYHDDVVYIKVTDCRFMLGRIAARFFDHPTEKLTVCGITGTNGKTSTTYFLSHVLRTAGKKIARMGTIDDQIGDTIIDNKGRTTSESRDLQAFADRAVREGADALVMEASSQALDLERLVDVDFDYAAFTNLTQDHLDYHKNFQNYFEAKTRLFDQTSKAAVINADDPWGRKLIEIVREKHPDLKIITYGTGSEADCRITDVDLSTSGSRFTIEYEGGSHTIFLDVIGRFMVDNATVAALIAHEAGISWEMITKALADAPVVEGRMERIKAELPFDIVVDYAHSPDALENLLKTVRELGPKRIICVFGCGGDRDKGKRPIMGEISAKGADFTVITSDNSRTEDPEMIIDEIEAAVKPVTDQYTRVTDRREATVKALSMAMPGDVVIFAGKGHEKTETSRKGVRPYYEKDVILSVIAEENLSNS